MFDSDNLRTLGINNKGAVRPMIAVDRVVGVRKGILMNILVPERGHIPFEEPVMNNPILDTFYYDRKRFSLQVFFLNVNHLDFETNEKDKEYLLYLIDEKLEKLNHKKTVSLV